MLEHCREVETNCWFCIFRDFILSIPNVTKDINVHFFIHSFTSQMNTYQRIPVNYACEFRNRNESLEAVVQAVLFADIKSMETIWVFVPRDGHPCRVPCSRAREHYLSEPRRMAKNTRVRCTVWILSLSTQQRTTFFPIVNSYWPLLSFSRGPPALLGLGFLLVKVSRSHAETPHSAGSTGQVIGPSQRPLPDNTHKSHKRHITFPQRHSNLQSQQASGCTPSS